MQKSRPTAEQFMVKIQSWRLQHPNRTEAYLQAIPKMVADSMAFEGDHVDVRMLKDRLSGR